MRILIITGIFLHAMVAMAFAQQTGALDLHAALEQYKRAVIDQKIDGVMGFVYPGVYKIMPQEQVRKSVEEMYESGTSPRIKQLEYKDIPPPKPYSKGLFTVVKYHVALEMPRPGDATPQIDQFIIKMMKGQLGDDIVITIDEKNALIKVAHDTQMLVLNEGNQGWKMIEEDNLDWLIGEQALPEDLAKLLQ